MRIISRIFSIISVLVIVWFMVSYFEIVSKNVKPNPNYSKYNFIVWIIDQK